MSNNPKRLDRWLVVTFCVAFLFNLVLIYTGLWQAALGAFLVQLLAQCDHAIWIASKDERKYEDTGPGCGIRMLFLK